ncbi:MAG: hypothetical protein GY774_16370 [Planctomycetes bacterium]|nr:hypothetical protein [Planctomycetota bacterium]
MKWLVSWIKVLGVFCPGKRKLGCCDHETMPWAEQSMKLARQIKLNKLRLERLAKGDAKDKITADGLEPELEAFIWPLLERIRKRANAESVKTSRWFTIGRWSFRFTMKKNENQTP